MTFPSTPIVVSLLLALNASCSAPSKPSSPERASVQLLPVTLPDLSRADEAVQVQARQRHAALLEKTKADAKGGELGAAYGELGMLLHAAEYFESAEPCYRNAQTLMPMDARWPYYLARLYESTGHPADAEAAYGRVLELEPADVPSLVRLGRLRLDRGAAADAASLFERARSADPRSVAAIAGLGQAAIATRDFERAVSYLEEGLEVDPRARSLHAPLANAYRALGRTAAAETHQKRWHNTEIPLPDVRREALDALLESGLSYELRGIRALSAEDWKGAEAFFRKGLALSPPDGAMARSLRHKLGTALWMTGDDRAATTEFESVVGTAPPEGLDEPSAKAHYSLGVITMSKGRDQEAIAHLAAAVRYQPSYAEARLALGDALRRAGRDAEALPEYEALVRIDPKATAGRFGYAVALVRLRRYVEARDWLTESLQVESGQPDLMYLLARVLAAAPDDRARDGRRALAVAEQLAATRKTPEVGETLAMALAEAGDFQRAVPVQRGVLDAAREARLGAEARRLGENLALYERQRPCRTPFRNDDPIFSPGILHVTAREKGSLPR